MQLQMGLSLIIALILTLIIMPKLIPILHKIKFGQSIRVDGPQSHLAKSGTPTMGGAVFVIVPIITLLLVNFKAFTNPEFLIVVFAYLSYALIGFIDDFIIVVKKDNDGLKPRYKFALQSILAIVFYFVYTSIATTLLHIPVVNSNIDIGILYFVLVFVMFTAESNAVNITDGLDGLCAGTSIIAIIPFIIFAIIQGNNDIAILLFAIIGALLGYLKFNKNPAQIFMGDTGSLALGGLLAATAMILKQELLLIIIGGVFLVEVSSVVIQVAYFKRTRKRIFKMSPIHHHYELSGYSETKIVKGFYLFGLVLAIIGTILGVL